MLIPLLQAQQGDFLTNRIRFDQGEGGGGAADDRLLGGDSAGDGQTSGDVGNSAQAGDTGGDAGAPYWPDDWREKYVDQMGFEGEDRDKELNILGRYTSPTEFMKAGRSAQRKISEGSYRANLPADATEAELAEYRKSNGIPETPDKYEVALSDGRVIGEEDKPFIDDFLKSAHESNMHPTQVNQALDWYYGLQERVAMMQHDTDRKFQQDTVDNLRQEWGQDYRINLNAGEQWLSGLPGGLGELLAGGRMADGTPIGSHPLFLKLASQLGREANPYTRVVQGDGDVAAKAIETELAQLRERMATDPKWHDDKAAQDRFMKLLDAQKRAKGAASQA